MMPARPMRLHILGICGTFMGGLAKLAREAGHTVTGCDANVYPPMSDQLRDLGVALHEGFDAEQLQEFPADLYVVGNAMTRGRPPAMRSWCCWKTRRIWALSRR